MSMYLMHKDTVVCNIDTGEIINSSMLPYGIAGIANIIDINILYRWLNKRAMPLNRKNSDKIYKAAGLGRVDQERNLLILTHGLSINDNYWIADGSKDRQYRWKDINLFSNKLEQSLTELAFTGTGPATITSNTISPETTGQGTYAKCFIRKGNDLILYKQGTNKEITAEIMASFTAKLLGINTIEYWHEILFDKHASACKIHTNESVSWESAFNFTSYTEQVFKLNVYEYAEAYSTMDFYAMILLDGLILNEDRHLQNWSIQICGSTNKILGLAPNYDFNRAFTADRLTMSQAMQHKNILSAAKEVQKVLNIDLITLLVPYISQYPKEWQDSLYNRIMYISGKKSNQNDCF